MTGFPTPAQAQQGLALAARAVFYGDNTEFRNPFREGETMLGVAARLEADVELNDRVVLSLGVFGNQRFGASRSFEQVRPVIALSVSAGGSRLLFGTLATPRAGSPAGPDSTGPHGLLPPLQKETLAFERPYETGLQWIFTSALFEHDSWLHWQRLNTPEHRERLDAGVRARWRAHPRIAIPLEAHIVHEGGQLHASGPVRDSLAMGSGVVLSNRLKPPGTREEEEMDPSTRISLELVGLWSRYTPDRELPHPTRAGGAFFGRFSVAQRGWRSHLLMWRGDDFIKDEGDPNYQSIRRDGRLYRGVRDYAELGVTRTFKPAPGALFEASLRVHRVERYYEYSYRVLSVVDLRVRAK